MKRLAHCFLIQLGNNMVTTNIEELFNKADKLGINRETAFNNYCKAEQEHKSKYGCLRYYEGSMYYKMLRERHEYCMRFLK